MNGKNIIIVPLSPRQVYENSVHLKQKSVEIRKVGLRREEGSKRRRKRVNE